MSLTRTRPPIQMVEDDFDMSKMIDSILAESGFSDSRASKMDVDDFLKCVLQLLVFPAALPADGCSIDS